MDTPGWSLLPELVTQSLAGTHVSYGLKLAWSQTRQMLVGAGDAKTVSGYGTCPHSQTAVSQP